MLVIDSKTLVVMVVMVVTIELYQSEHPFCSASWALKCSIYRGCVRAIGSALRPAATSQSSHNTKHWWKIFAFAEPSHWGYWKFLLRYTEADENRKQRIDSKHKHIFANIGHHFYSFG
jgi:hypothetical protein